MYNWKGGPILESPIVETLNISLYIPLLFSPSLSPHDEHFPYTRSSPFPFFSFHIPYFLLLSIYMFFQYFLPLFEYILLNYSYFPLHFISWLEYMSFTFLKNFPLSQVEQQILRLWGLCHCWLNLHTRYTYIYSTNKLYFVI